MGILKVLGQLVLGLTVLALFLGVILAVITLAWVLRVVLILIAVVVLIMYAFAELFRGKKRRKA